MATLNSGRSWSGKRSSVGRISSGWSIEPRTGSKSLDRRSTDIKEQESRVIARDTELKRRAQELDSRQVTLDKLEGEERRRLERVAGLSAEDAKRELMQKVEDAARGEAAALARDIKDQAKRSADKDAKRILSMAIQRIAAEYTAESTVAAVTLPNDEMKGRIIGREGRNIRAFEDCHRGRRHYQ